jgi:type II secretory ATPase GspE/PulE/Tfp pilus assembly ATPase PilB-like protein
MSSAYATSPTLHSEDLPLGSLMLAQGLISQDQLNIALKEQALNPLPLGKQLVQLGFVTEFSLRDILAAKTGYAVVDLQSAAADVAAIQLVPEAFARRYRILPLSFNENSQQLIVAVADSYNLLALDQLAGLLPAAIKVLPLLAAEAQLDDYLDRFYGYELSVDGILREIETGEIDTLAQESYTQPVLRLVDALLVDAVKRNASDIHFEPEYGFLRVRYRLDGVLQQIRSLHKSYWPAVLVRLKVICGMDIAETRAPQDGHLQMRLCGRIIDFRAATHPTIHGENLVLRILDREKSIIPLSSMGLRPEILQQLQAMLQRPEGILIVTGPTGSGKTTTLYSLLAALNHESVNIMTLEDPVEYPLNLMRQTSVSESYKLDFASGIRSIMRQDPDVILVGEIRDSETASMAFRAAMTGHQVFTTLHTNSALASFSRLWDIGILPELMAGNMIGVVAQRLVRKLCAHCKTRVMPDSWQQQLLQLLPQSTSYIYQATGCAHCAHTGYHGRMALIELLAMDDELDALVARRAAIDQLRQAAQAKGMVGLAQDAIRRVLEGHTSLAEVMRVVDLRRPQGVHHA